MSVALNRHKQVIQVEPSPPDRLVTLEKEGRVFCCHTFYDTEEVDVVCCIPFGTCRGITHINNVKM